MTTYSYAQLEGLWIQAGGPRSLAPLMAAIALAESSGNPAALNLTDNGGRQTSVGLWQVSNGTHSYPAAWRTPLGNAREAVAKYHTQGLTAWGTYDSGAYRRFLHGGVPPGLPPSGSGKGVAEGGAGTSPGGGAGGGATQAQLTSFLVSPSGVLSEAGALLHGTAVIIDRAFGLFAPGQGWRIVFGATAGLAGFGSYRAFHQGGDDDQGNLPLAVLLLGVGTVALFMMARPWPQTEAGPIKPGAYVVDVLEGQPPPAGPAAFSADEVHLTEAGLAAILAVWAAGKVGNALGGLAAGAAAGAGIFGKLWGWIKGLGGEATPPGEAPPVEAPPVELPPVL